MKYYLVNILFRTDEQCSIFLTLVLGFNHEVIADTISLLDVRRCIESQKLTLRHDANAVGKFVSLLDVLSAHND